MGEDTVANAALTWTVTDPETEEASEDVVTVEGGVLTIVGAGEAVVTAQLTGAEGETLKVSVTVTVAQADATVTNPTVNSLTYTGSAQALVRAGSVTGGTMVYSTTQDGTYTTTIPTGTDVGSYTVWYKVNGDSNHTSTTPASLTVAIAPAKPALAITSSVTSMTGGGTVTLTVTGAPSEGEVVVSCDSATVKQNENGTWSVYLPNGTATYTFTVSYEATANYAAATAQCSVSTATYVDTSAPVEDTTPSSSDNSSSTANGSTGSSGNAASDDNTVTNLDGSTTTTSTSTTTDRKTGAVTETTTSTTTGTDGAVTESTVATTTAKDGTVTETSTEKTTDADGAVTESEVKTVTGTDGTVTQTANTKTTDADGVVTETKSETVTNEDGTVTATGTTTVTDADGSVTVTESATTGATDEEGTTTMTTNATTTSDNGTVTESELVVITTADGAVAATYNATTTDAEGTVTTTASESTTTADGATTQTTTETVTTADGVVTTTETVAATTADGTTATVVTTTDENGVVVTNAEAEISEDAVAAAAESGEAVTLPVSLTAAKAEESHVPTVTLTVPETADGVKVEIPVENITPSTVVVLVKEDGTEEIVKLSALTDNGLTLNVAGNVTVKLVDNSKNFEDTDDHWANDSIAFATSHELFNGTGEGRFDPEMSMSRAMLTTVLARLDGVDTSTGSTWDEVGTNWAKEHNISDGTNGDAEITREQLATMLYRYAGEPDVVNAMGSFNDADQVSSYADDAMNWAVGAGLINGMGNGQLNPTGNASRAQVATILERFVSYMVK
jgi:hypothetical protein